MSQDLDNLLPTTSIRKESDRVRVVQRNKDYVQTDILPIQVFNDIVNKNYNQPRNSIIKAACLSIEDIKRSKSDVNCWKFHNLAFKNVLVYGKIVFLNEWTRDDRSYYSLSIDDETECITGYMNKTNGRVAPTEKKVQDLNKGKTVLERRKETGINIYGQYYPSESEECKTAIENLKQLQTLIEKNLKKSARNYPLGPLKEKALVYATPIYRHDQVQLNIFDISVDDSLDLLWKRNLNRLYSESYFK